MNITSKACGRCRTIRHATAFKSEPRNADGLHSWCRDCVQGYDRDWAKRNGRAQRLRKKYGMSLEEYDALLASQGGKCALCGDEIDETVHTLVPCVDHDHDTGEVRGILHRACNSAIGLLGDDAERCLMAAAYLTRAASMGRAA